MPTPGWTSYYEMVGLAARTAVPVRGDRARQLKVTPDDLRARRDGAHARPDPQLAVQSHRRRVLALRAGGDRALAAEHDWWIVSDEIYRAISYDGEARSLLSVVA